MKPIFLLYIIFISSILLSVSISSCLKDDVPLPVVAATRLDTLQGKWRYDLATLRPSDRSGPFMTVINLGDTLQFKADLSGTNEIKQFSIPVTNFTYNLLNDSTIIYNNNPGGTPVFDTAIITSLTIYALSLKSYNRTLTMPGGSPKKWDVYWNLRK